MLLTCDNTGRWCGGSSGRTSKPATFKQKSNSLHGPPTNQHGTQADEGKYDADVKARARDTRSQTSRACYVTPDDVTHLSGSQKILQCILNIVDLKIEDSSILKNLSDERKVPRSASRNIQTRTRTSHRDVHRAKHDPELLGLVASSTQGSFHRNTFSVEGTGVALNYLQVGFFFQQHHGPIIHQGLRKERESLRRSLHFCFEICESLAGFHLTL